jgi:hypothetical protein
MTTVDVDLRTYVAMLIRQHRGLRKAARALELDPAYLHRLKTGEKTNPSKAVLRKLGVCAVVTYQARSTQP